MKRLCALFLYALLAGVCISLGGTVYLRIKDAFPGGNVVGAIFFAVGLLTICTRGYALFTGKVCYLFANPLPAYLLDLFVIWVGNFLGCMAVAFAQSFTSLFGAKGINVIAAQLVETKSQASLLSFFILGIFCNIFIYLAVNGFANVPHDFGKYLVLFMGVSCFILVGTEHCVADMYFWCVSGVLYTAPAHSLLILGVITLGNTVGGLLFWLAERANARLSPTP